MVQALHARLHARVRAEVGVGGLAVVTRSTLALDARFRASMHALAPAGALITVQTADETAQSFRTATDLLSPAGPVVQDAWARALLFNLVGAPRAPAEGVVALLLAKFSALGMRFCPENGDVLHIAAAQQHTGLALLWVC